MSNLSELLPAGGSAKEFEAVASGTLPNGRAVVLKANGQVEAAGLNTIAQSIPAGNQATFNAGNTGLTFSIAFDPYNANKFILIYRNASNGGKGTVVIGTVSGTSMSFGTAVTFSSSGQTNDASYQIAFDPNTENKFAFAYQAAENNYYGQVIVGTVSGTSITFGTAVVFESSITNYTSLAFNPNAANTVLVGFAANGGSTNLRVIVGTISGTSVSFGNAYEYTASAGGYFQRIAFDTATAANKFVVVWVDKTNDTRHGSARLGTISGTTVSFASAVVFSAATTANVEIAFDPQTSGKGVVVYKDNDNSQYGTSKVASISGNTLSFGSAAVFNSGSTYYCIVACDPNTVGRAVVIYTDGSNQYGKAIVGQISGTSISYGSAVTYNADDSRTPSFSFDPNTSGKFVVPFFDDNNSNYGTAIVGQLTASVTNLTSTNLLGTSTAAFTNGQTATIVPKGGVAASVSNITLLQSYGSEVVYNAGRSDYNSVAFDPNNANKFVIVYKDNANSNYGTAIVGTVSGTTISFGSEVVFNAESNYTALAFDPNTANKFVVTYADGANNNYGTAILGTISGTNISFGSEVVYQSSESNSNTVSFDPNTANKFVIAYLIGVSSGNAIVGTVSGTSLSFGTTVVYEAAKAEFPSISFDPNTANKFIIAYNDGGDSDKGKAIVGTLSGTTTSFGSAAVFNTSATGKTRASFDPNTAGKFVVAYRGGASENGNAVVGTVSGTSISFGTSVVFNSGTTPLLDIDFDPNTANRFIIAYRDGGNSNHGTAIVGTVSGTNISFGSAVVFNSPSTDWISISFDPNTANNYVIAYKDNTNSNYGTAIVGNASDTLTIGSTYYVQSDGTVSTVSTSPAIILGKAVSSTSLILKGNS